MSYRIAGIDVHKKMPGDFPVTVDVVAVLTARPAPPKESAKKKKAAEAAL